jgi:hypothetical protein
MTLTRMRMRVRVSKYIILVNHIGTKMGTKFLYLYFIDIKQLLNASKWRRDSPPNICMYMFSHVHLNYILLNILPNHSSTSPYAFIAVPIKPCYFRGMFMVTSSDERTNYAKETK